MVYLVHAGVGDVVLLRLQDNGVGEGYTSAHGCWGGRRPLRHPWVLVGYPHPSNAYLEWWGDTMALLGHPAALREMGAVGVHYPTLG